MNVMDMISMAGRNLFKRKLRTFLTVLGVVIGTTAIIVMVSLGIAIKENLENEMKNWGNLQIITVNNPAFNYDGMKYDESGNATMADKSLALDEKMIAEFLKMPGVEAATPIIEEYLVIGSGKYLTDARIIGIEPKALSYLGLTLEDGRFFDDKESGVAIFGSQIGQNFRKASSSGRQMGRYEPVEMDLMDSKLLLTYDWQYGTRDANKQIKGQKLKCIGILEGQSYDVAYTVYVPINDLKKLQEARKKYEQGMQKGMQNKKIKGYQTAWVKSVDVDGVKGLQDQIKAKGFDAWSNADMLDSVKQMTNTLQMFLGAIGAVSLFVAAIGIANTMVMSIYERTKEIGVMKVIGASLNDIRSLFLTEAAFIGFLGGCAGVFLSLVISYLLNTVVTRYVGDMMGGSQRLSSIPFWLIILALTFSTFIGVLFGYFPARRAMKLSVLSAIRNE